MDNQTRAREILPCPFCGTVGDIMEGHRNHWRVECPKCGVRRAQFANGGVEEDKARAVNNWNKRALTPPAMSEEARIVHATIVYKDGDKLEIEYAAPRTAAEALEALRDALSTPEPLKPKDDLPEDWTAEDEDAYLELAEAAARHGAWASASRSRGDAS